MSMFSSGNERSRPAARGPVRESGLSIVAPGMRIVGELTTEGVVKVEGVVAGSIRAGLQVLVAKGGVVEGDIHTREAIVAGKVVGAVHADDRVEVQSGSIVDGDIATQRIMVQEGGEVNGHVRMGRPASSEKRAGAGATARPIPAGSPRSVQTPVGSGTARQ